MEVILFIGTSLVFIDLCLCSGLLCNITGSSDTLTPELRKSVLDRHNYYRSLIAKGNATTNNGTELMPSAKNMYKLVYDCNLEVIAQGWADGCRGLMHSEDWYRRAGENLFMIFGKGYNMDLEKALEWGVRTWFEELDKMGMDTNDTTFTRELFRTGIGHLTQLAWGRTTHVGCGIAICEKNDTMLISCNYREKGNYFDQPVWEIGPPCQVDEDCTTFANSTCDAEMGLCEVPPGFKPKLPKVRKPKPTTTTTTMATTEPTSPELDTTSEPTTVTEETSSTKDPFSSMSDEESSNSTTEIPEGTSFSGTPTDENMSSTSQDPSARASDALVEATTPAGIELPVTTSLTPIIRPLTTVEATTTGILEATSAIEPTTVEILPSLTGMPSTTTAVDGSDESSNSSESSEEPQKHDETLISNETNETLIAMTPNSTLSSENTTQEKPPTTENLTTPSLDMPTNVTELTEMSETTTVPEKSSETSDQDGSDTSEEDDSSDEKIEKFDKPKEEFKKSLLSDDVQENSAFQNEKLVTFDKTPSQDPNQPFKLNIAFNNPEPSQQLNAPIQDVSNPSGNFFNDVPQSPNVFESIDGPFNFPEPQPMQMTFDRQKFFRRDWDWNPPMKFRHEGIA